MPDDGVLVAGMTQVGYYSRPNFSVYHPRTYLTSSYFGNLGYAYPTALGAKGRVPGQGCCRSLWRRRLPLQLPGAGHGGPSTTSGR